MIALTSSRFIQSDWVKRITIGENDQQARGINGVEANEPKGSISDN